MRMDLELDVGALRFDERGLIPAVVQDLRSRKVLTLAYMNRESLEITLREGRTCFYSRSRGTLWRKGETSGNVQRVASVRPDCDGDALLVEVVKDGPACHRGTDSCFDGAEAEGTGAEKKGDPRLTIDDLYRLLQDRNERRPEGSYTTYLFEKGLEKILKKCGEEATEVVVAAMKGSREETIYELADLCYHALVLMVQCGVTLDEVRGELASRHVVDHKVKQEALR
ncbi:bifunctional phosphoribosyl-AMP cyclohydrolase/phosphoribosyl-ATP diphosphatase HisIE [uncultured Fretibacterium sp.]|uniref:bifunctional phosphoribosyl-AMP cyclohydrolase/phosphoribosyl-ATP diphosphatase HisIE n=1 Tax=uncultured Fretibacterium sp. TaxID=1678694 RepID=UPI00263525D9|nr:bifunctional phosphoribosyl-AMP cyclohydrolase/phosphoribosyl-ATP diphosphatase HisIE [uncultured Fretibacterium sp.]